MSDNAPKPGKNTGRFITFEGGEGVGKSTQIQYLAERFRKLGFQVQVSREPGGTTGAEAIRHVILEAGFGEPFGPEAEAMLFAAARNDHVNQLIRPGIANGDIVIIDRYMDSTRVYQGVSGELNADFVAALERVAIDGVVPDITILLDLDPAIGMERAASRRSASEDADRFEKEQLDIHEARRDAFLALSAAEPERFIVVDANASIEQISDEVWRKASQHDRIAPLLEKRIAKALESS
ncbi:MAG: dTMP kinase [Pseudomonadota bacterium]